MNGLEGKTAVVTGGSRGIGKAIVLELARNKVNIAFTYNQQSPSVVAKFSEDLRKMGVRVLAKKVDLKEENEVAEFIAEIKSSFPVIDYLVNNAGIIKDRTLMMMETSQWRDVIETNLTGTYLLTRGLILTFLKQKKGTIVNISSTSGIIGAAGQTNYSASKAGIIGFTKSLAKEVGPFGIRVNAVAPGFIDTDMLKNLQSEKLSEAINLVPMKRIGEPIEVANVVLFLLSGLSSYITGQIVAIDGGLAI